MDITDEDIPQGRMLTEEEDRQIKETLAQRNFGMRLAEFTKAWKSGAFDGDTGMSCSWHQCCLNMERF